MTQATIKVYGVKSALKELNKINPSLRRQFTKRYKDIVKPVLKQAKIDFPKSPPLSGMGRPHTRLGGWDGGLVAKGVVAKIDTRKGKKRQCGRILYCAKNRLGFHLRHRGPQKSWITICSKPNGQWSWRGIARYVASIFAECQSNST
jgi:hypothetical protein